jgi:hypothetical protein
MSKRGGKLERDTFVDTLISIIVCVAIISIIALLLKIC